MRDTPLFYIAIPVGFIFFSRGTTKTKMGLLFEQRAYLLDLLVLFQ